MTPAHRELLDAGYLPIFDAAQRMIPETRIMFNTNDVVITAFVGGGGQRTALYGKTRQRTLDLIVDVMPEAHKALARLEEGPLPPDMFLVLLIATPAIYVVDWPILERETQGVLN